MSRFHHALADGMALAEVLLSLTDPTPTADLEDIDVGSDLASRPTAAASSPASRALVPPGVRGAVRPCSGLPH